MSTQTPALEPIATKSVAAGAQGFSYALQRFFNNITGLLEYQRTANVFTSVQLSATGNVWTPSAATLKFRLMGFSIQLPVNAAISGGGVVTTVKFQDAAGNDIGLAYDFFAPTTAVVTGNGDSPPIVVTLPGNGYLSTTANNTLVANISNTLTTSKFRINVFGTEE